MKTTKTTSPLSKAAIFAKTALIATVALTGGVTSAEAASFTTIDFDTDSNGNALEDGTIVNGKQYNDKHNTDIGKNPWKDLGVTIERKGGKKDNGLTLFNSSCDPNYSDYSGFSNDCTGSGSDNDLATGGNLGTRARGNILIAQHENFQHTDANGRFTNPNDELNGNNIIKFKFDKKKFKNGVAIGNVEFIDFDKTDSNKISFLAKDANNNKIADYTFSKEYGYIADNITKQVFINDSGKLLDFSSSFLNTFNQQNFDLGKLDKDLQKKGKTYTAVSETNKDKAFTGEELTGNPFVKYKTADHGLGGHKELENSIWDFYFPEKLEGVSSLEVKYSSISGGISEISYAEVYEDFNTQSKERVPEPGTVAALAFIGGGMFLTRRRQSK